MVAHLTRVFPCHQLELIIITVVKQNTLPCKTLFPSSSNTNKQCISTWLTNHTSNSTKNVPKLVNVVHLTHTM